MGFSQVQWIFFQSEWTCLNKLKKRDFQQVPFGVGEPTLASCTLVKCIASDKHISNGQHDRILYRLRTSVCLAFLVLLASFVTEGGQMEENAEL